VFEKVDQVCEIFKEQFLLNEKKEYQKKRYRLRVDNRELPRVVPTQAPDALNHAVVSIPDKLTVDVCRGDRVCDPGHTFAEQIWANQLRSEFDNQHENLKDLREHIAVRAGQQREEVEE
jgi:hypothetical protein